MTMHGCAYGGTEPLSPWIQESRLRSGIEEVLRDRGALSSEGSYRRPVSSCTIGGKAWRNGRVRRARSSSGEGEAAAEWDSPNSPHPRAGLLIRVHGPDTTVMYLQTWTDSRQACPSSLR